MEKSLMLKETFMNEFGLEEQDLRTYSPLTLAYIGDAIFELVVRTVLVERKNTQPEKLHKAATKIVKAETQALMIEALKEDLTDEELTVYKRGRNAKAVTRAKNATMSEYRRATGFEALMGYLYLKGDMERMVKLIHMGVERAEVTL
ncbi:MAG: ribonuclease III domain-containing protein [Lachnospiraceae bacterium]|nr:ribonuclease III domain-containing protein [Lachnospiraceae bacterium]